MLKLTVRIPDDTHERLKEIARHRGMGVNELLEELSNVAVTRHEAETRLRAQAARRSAQERLRLLDEVDEALGGFETG